MTFDGVRFSLFGIFLAFLAIQLASVFAAAGTMWPEDVRNLAIKLLTTYAAPLGVILGSIAAKPKARTEDPTGALAWAAIILAVVWNLLLAWRSVSFALSRADSVNDLIAYMDAIAGSSSFLVAGVLAFFFGKGAEAR